jgi:hypothetical protein
MISASTFPQRLTKIDDLARPDHFYLTPADDCYFLGEYTARKGYAFSATNQLILNFKKSMNTRHTAQWRYKEQAIGDAAAPQRPHSRGVANSPGSINRLRRAPVVTLFRHMSRGERMDATVRARFFRVSEKPDEAADLPDLLLAETKKTLSDRERNVSGTTQEDNEQA